MNRRVALPPDPDQAWRALDLTTRMVSHAEGKAALTLASAGVVGGALFSTVRDADRLDAAAACAAAACGLLILASSLFAVVSLWSRVWRRDEATSLLYFHHIARRYPDSPQAYVEALCDLTRERERLAAGIAAQIWANAHVATRKFHWVNLGIGALLGGLALLGVTCALLALR